MSAFNPLDLKQGVFLTDIETVRLIYTHKQKYNGRETYAIHLTRVDLENLIKQLDALDKPGQVGNGVTFYMGEYPSGYPVIENQEDEDYSDRLTVVAVPTYGADLNGPYKDFMDIQTIEDCVDRIIKGEPPLPTVKALDHFKLCPPHTNCNTSNVLWNNIP